MLVKNIEEAQVVDSTSPKGQPSRRRHYFGPDPGSRAEELEPGDLGPQLFLVELTGGDELPPHFHQVDQYQLVVEGAGRIGKHELRPGAVHYTDGSSPYGPIAIGPEGMSFFTVRQVADLGGHIMPGAKDAMQNKAGRNLLWDIPDPSRPASSSSVEIGFEEEDGVFACVVSGQANEAIKGPDPAGGAGQFVIVLAGSCMVGDEQFGRLASFHLDGDEPPIQAIAGHDGARLLVLQFRRNGPEPSALGGVHP